MRLRVPAFAAAVVVGAFLATGSAALAEAPVATYEVTITDSWADSR